VHRGAARAGLGANRCAFDRAYVCFGKIHRGAVVDVNAVGVEKEDGPDGVFRDCFDAQYDCSQDFPQRGSCRNHAKNPRFVRKYKVSSLALRDVDGDAQDL
jgi:hypothetical protein